MPDPSAHNHDQRYYTQAEASAVVQAALPVPTRIEEGRIFTVPEDVQMAFRFPIQVDGELRIDGILYEI